mmetsp:Transcript_45032/g.86086  ORF Transcript_45032/g.86086 Transcript_45032/m.86086 type:complete len:202 (+) Transcript_45032:1144-1749(+)
MRKVGWFGNTPLQLLQVLAAKPVALSLTQPFSLLRRAGTCLQANGRLPPNINPCVNRTVGAAYSHVRSCHHVEQSLGLNWMSEHQLTAQQVHRANLRAQVGAVALGPHHRRVDAKVRNVSHHGQTLQKPHGRVRPQSGFVSTLAMNGHDGAAVRVQQHHPFPPEHTSVRLHADVVELLHNTVCVKVNLHELALAQVVKERP